MPAPEIVYSRLHLSRPLPIEAVLALSQRLASDRDAPRLVFELRASEHGVIHALGCAATDLHHVRRVLTDLVPGIVLTGLDHPREAVDVAGHLRLRPPSLALRADPTSAMAITRALLSAVAVRLRSGECVVLQIVLGPRLAPRVVPNRVSDPRGGLLGVLLHGDQQAPNDLRQRIRDRVSSAGFQATIRIGAASRDNGRRRRFIVGLHSAISTAQSPGLRIDVAREHPDNLNGARLPWRWPLRLAAHEVVALLGWPLGDEELPGLPPLHPQRLRPAANVASGDRVFATSAAPGDTRQVGISIDDQMMHGIAYGPSGSGKTTALTHLILADIAAGRPVCVIDPKWQLIEDLLAHIPESRQGDIVLLNAASSAPVGFNPLDATGRDPDVVVDGIMAVFEALFSSGWGPRTSDIFSSALRTLMRTATPHTPAVLTDLPRLLLDPGFRRPLVARVRRDEGLAQFWDWYEALSPNAQASALAAPLNKLRSLLNRPGLMRLLSQRQPGFRLRDIWQENKVVLVPLNEAIIGTGTAELLGSLIIAELWQATQERGNQRGAAKRPGVVYVDEAPRFLNLPVSLADALAVSRSLSVGWFLAAQFRAQFPPELRAAVDMNARNKIVFATEYDDAHAFAKMAPALTAEDFIALPKYHAYVNLVAGGHPSGWAMVSVLPPSPRITNPTAVAARSERTYAARPTATQEDPTQPSAPTAPAPGPGPATVEAPIGRVRRQR
jgi:hypothetical protein